MDLAHLLPVFRMHPHKPPVAGDAMLLTHSMAAWIPFVSAVGTSCNEVQVTLVIRTFAIRVFTSMKKEILFYPLQNFKPYNLHRTFSTLIKECDAHENLSFKKFWRLFNVKIAIVTRFPVYAVSIYTATCRNSNSVHNESTVLKSGPMIGIAGTGINEKTIQTVLRIRSAITKLTRLPVGATRRE